jgi:hypothetical protein
VARLAQWRDHRADVAKHSPPVHEHLIELLGFLPGLRGLGARRRQGVFEIGDAKLELGDRREALLRVDQQLGQPVPLLQASEDVSIRAVGIVDRVGQVSVHAWEATVGSGPTVSGYDRRVPEVAFVMSGAQDPALRDLAEVLQYELSLQAIPSTMHTGGFPPPRTDRVYILLDPRSYVAAEGPASLPDDAVLRRTVFLAAEAAPVPGDDRHRELLGRAGSVFVIDQRDRVTIERLGVRTRLLRPGYSRSLDHFDPEADRPIDVVFLGARTARRTLYLERAAPVFARLRTHIHLSDPGDPETFLGAERWPLLTQAKVVVNLHCGDQTRLEWRRVIDAVHAGAVVVTEHSSGIDPLVAGEHLLVASADSLPFVVEALVRDPERLAAIRAAAYERLSGWIPAALPVSVLRAALVELVGEPDPGLSRSAGA